MEDERFQPDQRSWNNHVTASAADHDAGILRLDLEPQDATLEPPKLGGVFQKFDEVDLSFLYQEKTADGHIRRFHEFVCDGAGQH